MTPASSSNPAQAARRLSIVLDPATEVPEELSNVVYRPLRDLRVGVQQAQEYGVRVHLLDIKPARGSQSIFLLQEADTIHEWDAANLDSCNAILHRRPVDHPQTPGPRLPSPLMRAQTHSGKMHNRWRAKCHRRNRAGSRQLHVDPVRRVRTSRSG